MTQSFPLTKVHASSSSRNFSKFKLKLPLDRATVPAALTTLSQLVNAQAEGQRLGDVHFETSCTAEAQNGC